MTREEAVEILTRLEINNFRSRSGKTYLTDALIMAINALQTEPCEDCISRQRVINEFISMKDAWEYYNPNGKYITYDDAVEVIKKLPSVQPEIIRCHQCKYAEVADSEDSQDGYTCQFHRGSIWFSGSYCSWAERRQDGD